MAAGIEILLGRQGLGIDQVGTAYLAGAFGNYVDVQSARSIGIFPFPGDRVEPAGNTALFGAKLLLLAGDDQERTIAQILARTEHLSLAADQDFQQVFVKQMGFPAASGRAGENG